MHNEVLLHLRHVCTASYTRDANHQHTPQSPHSSSFLILLLLFFCNFVVVRSSAQCSQLARLYCSLFWCQPDPDGAFIYYLCCPEQLIPQPQSTLFSNQIFFPQQIHLAMEQYCSFSPAVLWFIPMPYCCSLLRLKQTVLWSFVPE